MGTPNPKNSGEKSNLGSRKTKRRSKNSLIVDAIDNENNDNLHEESSMEDESQSQTEEDITQEEPEEIEPDENSTLDENDDQEESRSEVADLEMNQPEIETEEGPVEPGSIRSVIDISNSLTVQKNVKAPTTFQL